MDHFESSGRLLARCLRVFLAAALIVFMLPSFGQKPDNTTRAEIARLPEYCPHTMGFDFGHMESPKAAYWANIMGNKAWLALHHYCWGLLKLARGQDARDPQIRQSFFGQAILEYTYVLNRAEPNFILLPEILTRKGDLEVQLGRIPDAYDSFLAARRVKPDYWPAYSKWAEVLIKSAQKAEAKKLVREGLQYSPNSEVLRSQYRFLGENPDTIPPVATRTDPAPASHVSTDQSAPAKDPEEATPKP